MIVPPVINATAHDARIGIKGVKLEPIFKGSLVNTKVREQDPEGGDEAHIGDKVTLTRDE